MAETIALVANVALALSLVVGLVFGIAQVRAAARDRRERLTLEALRGFQSRDFVELMQYIIAHDIPKSRAEMSALPDREQVVFLQCSQAMEMLGLLVAERLIDLDLVERTLGSFVTTSWEKLKSITVDVRQTDPFLHEYFQWLAERIGERMSRHPRRPFHETGPRPT
ncbi:MAG TPA: hypothetical protein VFH83_09390 [Spirochaetia bacterium]|nr:hypothetical protein [Spirochaetia bacterium]